MYDLVCTSVEPAFSIIMKQAAVISGYFVTLSLTNSLKNTSKYYLCKFLVCSEPHSESSESPLQHKSLVDIISSVQKTLGPLSKPSKDLLGTKYK